MAEPYLVTVIRQIAGLEAEDAPSPDETARLAMCRRWLAEHYPDVSAALAREYREQDDRLADAPAVPSLPVRASPRGA